MTIGWQPFLDAEVRYRQEKVWADFHRRTWRRKATPDVVEHRNPRRQNTAAVIPTQVRPADRVVVPAQPTGKTADAGNRRTTVHAA